MSAPALAAVRIHILGVCGTFMGGLARIARQLGHAVSGSDANTYPPMSTQLQALGIDLHEGYDAGFLRARPDLVLVGNALSRGNAAIEALLDSGIRYQSGPQWLHEAVLDGRRVIAVAGTHGKTTTSSLIAWILEQAGLAPGFLIGGVALDLGVTARLGAAPHFVIEADEYDTAFFDKRSKFLHYRPNTVVMNNLEYDHADIFPDLAAIQTQFAHLLRTVPASGLVLCNATDAALAEVVQRGCWTPVQPFAPGPPQRGRWSARRSGVDTIVIADPDGGEHRGRWSMPGEHNLSNALAAVAAAHRAGVTPAQALAALACFGGVARRLQVVCERAGVTVYDDFAHHPTAIRATLRGLRERLGDRRLLVALEPRSNTMRAGVHKDRLAQALADADRVFVWHRDDLQFDPAAALVPLGERVYISDSVDSIAKHLIMELQNGDHVVLMSNGSFGGLHDQLVARIDRR